MLSTGKDLLDEVQRQGEMRMQSLQQIAIAADARAMQFGAACVATAAVVLTISSQAEMHMPGYICAIMLLIAAAMAFWTAKPSDWFSPGQSPKEFECDLKRDRTLLEIRQELVAHLSDYIDENERTLNRNGKIFRAAKIIALSAPLLSLLAYATPKVCQFIVSAN